MHRWDSQLRPPPPGITPVRWADAPERLGADGAAAGGRPTYPSRAQLRGPGWRRSSRGFYVPAGRALAPEQRIAEAAALLPGYGAIGGWASAYWQGVRLLDGRGATGLDVLPVLLCLGPYGKIRRRDAVRFSRDRLPPQDVTQFRGIHCTTLLRTAFDASRRDAELVEAVVHLDLMITAGTVDREELGAYIRAHPGWRGVEQARAALALSVEGSRSPPETRMRLAWLLDAKLPTPLVNPPMFDLEGNLLGYPDLLDPESGTVSEYDSDDHRDLVAHTADNSREELFEHHGLVVTRVTRLDLRAARRPALVTRFRQAHARGLRRDREQDGWTLQPPPHWRGV